jgi:hypothetical protein
MDSGGKTDKMFLLQSYSSSARLPLSASRGARWVLCAAILLASPALSLACVLCTSQGAPLSKEIAGARLVVYGKITDARLGPDGMKGTSDFAVETLLQGDASLVKNNRLVLPRYVPPVPGVKYVVFLDILQGQIDPYRSIVCSSNRLVEYLQKMPKLTGAGTPAERQARLKFTFEYFQDAEPELAADAYKEWSVANDKDVAAIASQVDPGKLRRWLLDPKTPQHCLSLYSYLLGASGTQADLELLKKLALSPPDARYHGTLDGILSGIQQQRPEEVWPLAQTILRDTNRTFTERYAVLRFTRFVKEVRYEAVKKDLNVTLALCLDQPDLVDLVIEQMRLMKNWEYAERVLQFHNASAAPITKRAVIRYALPCPLPAAREFIRQVRLNDPETVKDVEELLELSGKPAG